MKNKKKKTAVVLLSVIGFAILCFIGIVEPVTLKNTEFVIKKEEDVKLSTTQSYMNDFIHEDSSKTFEKPGDYECEAEIFYKNIPYHVTVVDYDESEVVIPFGESYALNTENLTDEASFSAEEGLQIVDGSVTAAKPGTYHIKIEDHGNQFTQSFVVLGFEKEVLYMKKGDSIPLTMFDEINGSWSCKEENVAVIEGNELKTRKDGVCHLVYHYKEIEVTQEIYVVSMEPFYYLSAEDTIELPLGADEWNADDNILSLEEDKKTVKAVTSGKTTYSLKAGDIIFQGEIYVSSLPKDIVLRAGEEISLGETEEEIKTEETEGLILIDNTLRAIQCGEYKIETEYHKQKREIPISVFSLNTDTIRGDNVEGKTGQIETDVKEMTFSSENESVAVVDETGKVTMTGEGMTNILCTYKDKEYQVPVCVDHYENGKTRGKVRKYHEDGSKNEMTVFRQHGSGYRKYNHFITCNGCSLCSLTCVLTGFTEEYHDKDPVDVMDGIEKDVVGEDKWNEHHSDGRDVSAMPITLCGVTQCLSKMHVATQYVPSFDREEMKKDIWEHLKTGYPVVIEVSQKNYITGQTDKKWSNSIHTVILVGSYGEDGVYVADPADRRGGSGSGRIKQTTLDSISEYMWSCSDTSPDDFYYNGMDEAGGYIKILPNVMESVEE